MYNRYGDLSKFITDADQLCTENDGYVYISKEEDYDIAVDMESCYGSLDEVRAFLVFLAKHICELDNLVQRFNQKNRMKKSGYVCLPHPIGVLRFDYLQSMEKEPDPQKRSFPLTSQLFISRNQISLSLITGAPTKIRSLTSPLNTKRSSFSYANMVPLTVFLITGNNLYPRKRPKCTGAGKSSLLLSAVIFSWLMCLDILITVYSFFTQFTNKIYDCFTCHQITSLSGNITLSSTFIIALHNV